MEEIKIGTLANGAVEERFNQALKEVLSNIQDPNTEHKVKRKISLTLTFVANENRDLASIDFDVKKTLAQPKNVRTAILIGTDGTGIPVAAEYQAQIPGQVFIDPNGEVIDFQKKSATK